jgi:hypothetical protein
MKTFVFLIGLCAATALKADRDYPLSSSSTSDVHPKPFQSGYEYVYRYDVQTSTGFSPEISQQKASTRLHSAVRVSFRGDQQAVLRMEHIRLGQLQEEIYNPEHVQPWNRFQSVAIPSEQMEKLLLPVGFSYSEGAVENIHFHTDDDSWSKNIKRAVLNIIQLRLNGEDVDGFELEQSQPSQEKSVGLFKRIYRKLFSKSEDNQENAEISHESFAAYETSIEGECKTTYSIYKAPRTAHRDESTQRRFNVTKSIDYQRCKRVGDISYGFQTYEMRPECNLQRLRRANQPEESPLESAYDRCDPKEVKEQKVDRSTVIRHVLNGENTQRVAIEQAEVLSHYVVKNHKTAQKYVAPMHVVVAAKLSIEKFSENS